MKRAKRKFFTPKPLNEQVIVITGATSGAGFATARLAAERGARLVLVARDRNELNALGREINAAGSICIEVVADVSIQSQAKQVVVEAVRFFGSVDTWINNAGVLVCSNVEDVPDSDSRQQFETSFWGVVNGSLLAAKHMQKKGGTIVNIGATLSDRAVPIHGLDSASKQAVKGFTDALRSELEIKGGRVKLSLVSPADEELRFAERSAERPTAASDGSPCVSNAEAAAETILYCAEHSVRDISVGGARRRLFEIGDPSHLRADVFMEHLMMDMQRSDLAVGQAAQIDKGSLASSNFYNKAAQHPVVTGAAVALGLGAAFAVTRRILSSGKESPIVNQ